MNYIFNIYNPKSLFDLQVGEKGYVIINPMNENENGFFVLSDEFLAIKKSLYLFNSIKQARRYQKVMKKGFVILGIERIGEGSTAKDYILDFSFIKEGNFINFSSLMVNKYKYKNNQSYIYFPNIQVKYHKDTENWLRKSEKYYLDTGDTFVVDDDDFMFDFMDFDFTDIDIKNENEHTLRKVLNHAISMEYFELASEIRDELIRRRGNKKNNKKHI